MNAKKSSVSKAGDFFCLRQTNQSNHQRKRHPFRLILPLHNPRLFLIQKLEGDADKILDTFANTNQI